MVASETWGIPLGSLVNAAGGLLFMLFGLWVATLRPRRPRTLAFAVYCLGFGLAFFSQNLISAQLPHAWNQAAFVLSGVGALPATVAAVLVARDTPQALPRDRRSLLAVPSAFVALFAVSFLLFLAQGPSSTWTLFNSLDLTVEFGVLVFGVQTLLAAQLGAAALMAMRYPLLPSGDDSGRRELAIMGSAFVAFPAFFHATFSIRHPNPVLALLGFLGVACTVAVGLLWLRASARSPGATASARNAALVSIGLAVLGLAMAVLLGGFFAVDATGAYGVLRILTVGLLAYAILRHHLLGLDLKVRWTVKNSTIAAAFVGVFFVASEVAQQFFSGSLGPYPGIVAAGGLVFAMAPLQRVADRVANAAVPVASSAEAQGAGVGDRQIRRRELYRVALRKFVADGRVSPEEEVALGRLADELGISAGDAAEERQRALAERAAQGAPRGRIRS